LCHKRTGCSSRSDLRVAQRPEITGIVLDDVVVLREFDTAGRARQNQAGVGMRRGLLHDDVRGGDARHGLEAQVARARRVVFDEVRAEVRAVDNLFRV
jgi:hypothetical protein